MSLKGGSSDQKSFQLAYRSLEGYANLLGRKVEVLKLRSLVVHHLKVNVFVHEMHENIPSNQ